MYDHGKIALVRSIFFRDGKEIDHLLWNISKLNVVHIKISEVMTLASNYKPQFLFCIVACPQVGRG